MKLFLLLYACVSATALASDLETHFPDGGVTDVTPSLEAAFPNEMYISRKLQLKTGVVAYTVQVYAPQVIDKYDSAMVEVALVVFDEKGVELFSTSLHPFGIAHIPPSKEKFRRFHFSVHESLEKTTAISIGRFTGASVLFTKYRLPLKTIDHPKAH